MQRRLGGAEDAKNARLAGSELFYLLLSDKLDAGLFQQLNGLFHGGDLEHYKGVFALMAHEGIEVFHGDIAAGENFQNIGQPAGGIGNNDAQHVVETMKPAARRAFSAPGVSFTMARIMP